MKRKITMLLTALFILALTGCAGTADTTASTPAPEDDTDTSFLGITLTAENVTPTGMTIVCTQSGGGGLGELNTGSWYRIDKLVDGEWMVVDYVYDGSQGELAWTMEAWLINMGGTTAWDVNWEFLYGELSPGTYRIAKKIMDFHGPGNYTEYLCYAEFVIE